MISYYDRNTKLDTTAERIFMKLIQIVVKTRINIGKIT